MGMFDHVIVNIDKLPITEEEKNKFKNKEYQIFQTKDFENILTDVKITDDGRLLIKECEYEAVPKEERDFPDAADDDIRGTFGSLRAVNIRWRDLEYHGKFRFYDYLGDYNVRNYEGYEWFEFEAKYTDGNLVEIKRVEEK